MQKRNTIYDLEKIMREKDGFIPVDSGLPKGAGRTLTFDQILKEDCLPLEYVLSPWFITQGISLVFAARGIGKTYFAFNIAFAIAAGTSFLKWDAPKPRKVLYVDGEMQFSIVKARAAMMSEMYKTQSNPNFNMLTPDKYGSSMPDLSCAEGQQIIDRHLADLECEVLVIDNIATLMSKLRGNDNDHWGEFIQPWLLDLRRRGIATFIVHHAGKPKAEEAPTGRGSTAKEDVADVVICLSRPVGYTPEQGARFNVQFTKGRHLYGDDARQFEAWLKDDGNGRSDWYTDDIKLSTFDQVCNYYNDGMTQVEITQKVKVSRQRVSELVKKGIKEGLIRA